VPGSHSVAPWSCQTALFPRAARWQRLADHPDRLSNGYLRRVGALMDQAELYAKLEERDVGHDGYWLVEVRLPPPSLPKIDPWYVLLRRDDQWVITFTERGQEQELGRYATEDAACQELYRLLTMAIDIPTYYMNEQEWAEYRQGAKEALVVAQAEIQRRREAAGLPVRRSRFFGRR